ncbi:d28484b2-6451-4680-a561-06d0fb3bff4c [Sclerotinia trifoliorum]|uniref:D28484b2-6451-4680-a561-06d0fb3bff4c n=1 Tax=Sclerotinia trifoliorum TaxID=28548 RepID=A0A8H2ZNF2_9HELO|nr:d28484b2-6451-4680-a561-06d0fb3bff4c [Sclerotinia trifoliorum]
MTTLPSTFKALRFSTLAGPLTIEEQKISSVHTPKTILIKVHFASINPVDTQLWRAGMIALVSSSKGMGRDFSGTIVDIGNQVKGNWSIGDEVFGFLFEMYGQGTFSQYITLDPLSHPMVKRPNCLSREAAAAIPLATLTMFSSFSWIPPARGTSQRRVIVRGASGGCGSWAVQMAKHMYNCHVTAICSSKNVDYVKSLGADEVIDYTSQPVLQTLLDSKTASTDFDLLVDCVGGTELIPYYHELLHNKGAYVTIVGDKTDLHVMGGPMAFLSHPKMIWRFIAGWIWGPRYAVSAMNRDPKCLEEIVKLAERGEAKVEIQEVIKDALNEEKQEWLRAIETIESGRVKGKIVLEIL